MSKRTSVRSTHIRTENVKTVNVASGSIRAKNLHAESISGHAEVGSADSSNDFLLILDATDSSLKKIKPSNLGVGGGGGGDITAVVAGTGLSGGANSGSATINLDINSLSADSNAGNLSDSIAIADDSDSNNSKKITLTQLKNLVDTNTTYSAGDGLDLTSTTFSLDLKSSGGLSISSTELTLDVNTLTAESGGGALADSIAISDATDNVTKKITLTQLKTLVDANTVRAVGVDTDGNGSTDNTLESNETLVLKAGTNVTLAESVGVVTINSTAGGGGDITSVVAGSGLSGGATSGDATINLDVNDLTAVTPDLSDSIAVSDASDSDNSKKSTLTQIKTLFGAGTRSFESVTIGGSAAGTLSIDASPTLAATIAANGTTITLNDGLGTDFSEVVLEFINSDGALTTKSNSVPINVTSISGTPLKSRLIFNIHPDHFHASNLSSNKWHTHWSTAGSESIRLQFRDYEGTTLTIIPVQGDVDPSNSFAVPGRPNVDPAGSGGCRRDTSLFYSVGIETGMQDSGEELLWNIAVCIYDAITRGEIKFESVNILHDTGFATSDLGAVSNSNYMGTSPGFGILSVDALMIISDTAESSGHPINMKIHKPAGKTWATLSAPPIKIYSDLHSSFNIDASSNFSAPTNTDVYYTQRAVYGKEQDSDSSLTNAEAATAMANVINNLPIQITATASNADVSLSTNQGNSTVQTNNGSAFGVTSFDGAGSVAIQDGIVSVSTGTGSPAKVDLYCENNAHKVTIKAPAHAGFGGDVNFTLPNSNGSNGQALISDGSGNTSWSTISAGISNVVEDTTPQLGGDLDMNGKAINHKFNITAGSGIYIFADSGNIWFPSSANNPTLYLRRGEIYTFALNVGGHPFYIKTSNSTGTSNQYTTGVTNNGADSGNLVFKVPMSAPSTLHYNCSIHSNMNGVINIV